MRVQLLKASWGLVLLMQTMPSFALPINIGKLNLDVTEGTFTNLEDSAGNPGMLWESAMADFDPIIVNEGDVISVEFILLDGQSLELVSGAYEGGVEYIGYSHPTNLSINFSLSYSSAFLTGVEGDINSLEVASDASVISPFFGGAVFTDMTDTAFSFHDIHFETVLFGLSEPLEISSFQLSVSAEEINAHVGAAVTEPGSIALLTFGLVGLSVARKCKQKRRT